MDGDLRLQQQFDSLKQQVQALLDREPSNEQLLSPGQLTQVQSLIQSSMNEAIEKTATAAAQAAVNVFRGPSPPAAIPTNGASSDLTLAHQTEEQDCYPSTSRENEVCPINSSTADSVHELPAKQMKTSSIAVVTSQSTSQSGSIVRQTNKCSFLSYTTMNNIHTSYDKKNKLIKMIFDYSIRDLTFKFWEVYV